MKKALLTILLASILLSTAGCTAVRIDTSNIDNIVNVVMSKENKLFNRVGKGYSYYIPREVNYIDTNYFNEVLYSNGDYYYLFVDIVSYYNNIKQSFEINDEAYYSKIIENDKHVGYIEINQIENKYLIEFTYDYSKIEALVDYDKINEVVLNSSYILSTVKYNKDVIKLILNDDFFTNKEEIYDEFISNKIDSYVVDKETDNNESGGY